MIFQPVGVILAGGQGRRLGGGFKGAWPFEGRPLLYHVAERLRLQVASLAVNANRAHPLLAGWTWFADVPPFERMGPLSGVHAALTRYPDRWVLIVPVDMPRLPPDLVDRLRQHLPSEPGWVYARGPQRDHPLVALVHGGVRPALAQFLAAGARRVMEFTGHIGAQAVSFDSEAPFLNCNRPEASG